VELTPQPPQGAILLGCLGGGRWWGFRVSALELSRDPGLKFIEEILNLTVVMV